MSNFEDLKIFLTGLLFVGWTLANSIIPLDPESATNNSICDCVAEFESDRLGSVNSCLTDLLNKSLDTACSNCIGSENCSKCSNSDCSESCECIGSIKTHLKSFFHYPRIETRALHEPIVLQLENIVRRLKIVAEPHNETFHSVVWSVNLPSLRSLKALRFIGSPFDFKCGLSVRHSNLSGTHDVVSPFANQNLGVTVNETAVTLIPEYQQDITETSPDIPVPISEHDTGFCSYCSILSRGEMLKNLTLKLKKRTVSSTDKDTFFLGCLWPEEMKSRSEPPGQAEVRITNLTVFRLKRRFELTLSMRPPKRWNSRPKNYAVTIRFMRNDKEAQGAGYCQLCARFLEDHFGRTEGNFSQIIGPLQNLACRICQLFSKCQHGDLEIIVAWYKKVEWVNFSDYKSYACKMRATELDTLNLKITQLRREATDISNKYCTDEATGTTGTYQACQLSIEILGWKRPSNITGRYVPFWSLVSNLRIWIQARAVSVYGSGEIFEALYPPALHASNRNDSVKLGNKSVQTAESTLVALETSHSLYALEISDTCRGERFGPLPNTESSKRQGLHTTAFLNYDTIRDHYRSMNLPETSQKSFFSVTSEGKVTFSQIVDEESPRSAESVGCFMQIRQVWVIALPAENNGFRIIVSGKTKNIEEISSLPTILAVREIRCSAIGTFFVWTEVEENVLGKTIHLWMANVTNGDEFTLVNKTELTGKKISDCSCLRKFEMKSSAIHLDIYSVPERIFVVCRAKIVAISVGPKEISCSTVLDFQVVNRIDFRTFSFQSFVVEQKNLIALIRKNTSELRIAKVALEPYQSKHDVISCKVEHSLGQVSTETFPGFPRTYTCPLDLSRDFRYSLIPRVKLSEIPVNLENCFIYDLETTIISYETLSVKINVNRSELCPISHVPRRFAIRVSRVARSEDCRYSLGPADIRLNMDEPIWDSSYEWTLRNISSNGNYCIIPQVKPSVPVKLLGRWLFASRLKQRAEKAIPYPQKLWGMKPYFFESYAYVPEVTERSMLPFYIAGPLIAAVIIVLGTVIGMLLYRRHKLKDLKRIKREEIIKWNEKIGCGNFADAWLVVWQNPANKRNQDVVVKVLKETATSKHEAELLAEAIILTKLDHPNIVKIIGICLDKTPNQQMFICLEFVPGGPLLQYLKRSDVRSTINAKELIHMLIQLCKACCYLEQQGFIHRDIACRNCLLIICHNSLVPKNLKLSDFGMARDRTSGQQFVRGDTRELPVAWTAPEALYEGNFSTASDVWSFGVLMWEMFSWGSKPFGPCASDHMCPLEQLSNSDIKRTVKQSNLLETAAYGKPCCALFPYDIYQLILRCFAPKDERPSFQTLSDCLALCANRAATYFLYRFDYSNDNEDRGFDIRDGDGTSEMLGSYYLFVPEEQGAAVDSSAQLPRAGIEPGALSPMVQCTTTRPPGRWDNSVCDSISLSEFSPGSQDPKWSSASTSTQYSSTNPYSTLNGGEVYIGS